MMRKPTLVDTGTRGPAHLRLTWRAHLAHATCLTLGLLGWELGLRWFIVGELGMDVGALGRRLAWDGAFLLPLFVAVLAFVTRFIPPGRRRGDVAVAASAALLFLVLLLPTAAVRSVVQQRASRPDAATPPETEREGSATESATELDGRFICSSVSTDATGGVAPDGGSPWEAAWSGAQDALLLHVPAFPLLILLLRRRRHLAGAAHAGRIQRESPPHPALLVALLTAGAWGSDARRPPADGSRPVLTRRDECHPAAPVRTYAVAAISVDIPLNVHGDHVPGGLMYALEEALPAIRAQEQRPWAERVTHGLREEPIQPLVLRANRGECLVIHFTNRIAAEPAAFRIEGLPASLGAASLGGGFHPGIPLLPGQRVTYVLDLTRAPISEGAYTLHDPGDGGARAARGLFGAFVVEPPGAMYRSSVTGQPLRGGTGWEAIIDVPDVAGSDFREMVLLFHAMGPPEVAEVRLANGALLPVLDEMAGPFRPGSFSLNYRSEPRLERDELQSGGEERPRSRASRKQAMPMLRSYLGEPFRLHLLHAGSAEFHLYALRAQAEKGSRRKERPPSSVEAPRLLSPGQALTLRAEQGPDSGPWKAGDLILSCRMPNHSIGGLRSTWRVFDVHQPDLAPLPDRAVSSASP